MTLSRLKAKVFLAIITLALLYRISVYVNKIRFDMVSEKLQNVNTNLNQMDQQDKITELDRRIPNIKLVNPKSIDSFTGDILVLVTSHIKFQDRRDTIRTTWGNSARFIRQSRKYKNVTYKVYFNTGYHKSYIEKAKIESSFYQDVLITNRTEQYWDLSRRVMFGFLWSLQNCKYDYLFKVDDDVFVNIPNLFNLIYTDPFVLKHRDRIYAGLISPGNDPIRDPFSKWFVSKEEWAPEHYPPFATGMGYILSRLIIEKMLPHFNFIKPFRLDDVYVGMLVDKANISGIGIRRTRKINAEFSGFNPAGDCSSYIKSAVTYHKVDQAWCMERFTAKSILYADQPYFDLVTLAPPLVFFVIIVVFIRQKISSMAALSKRDIYNHGQKF